MSNRNLFILVGGLFVVLPILSIVAINSWFENRFVQLENFADTELVFQQWELAEGLNTCNFNITKEKKLVTTAHPNEIWARTPDAWQKGTNAHAITEPKGFTDQVYLGFIRPTERVFVNYKENQPNYEVFSTNTLALQIPLGICNLFR